MTRIWRPLCREAPEKTQIDVPDAETDTGQAHVLVEYKAHCQVGYLVPF